MCRFIETIRIDHGEIRNLSYHDRRMNDTRMHLWKDAPLLWLADYVKPVLQEGVFKARVIYGEGGIEEITYTPYSIRHVQSLALVRSDSIDYPYKSTDREALNRLFDQRGACDDILIVKQGLLTDTSIANIALFDGACWYTPKQPLLKGTKRAQLLAEGILYEKNLQPEDLPVFSTIRLFNAMIDWGELELSINALHPTF